jgi:peptidoglycan/LPS O-acetylase OafA/YrhL
MRREDEQQREGKRPGWGIAVLVALSLFVGFWAFVYQGYTEDAGLSPVQSWPVGAVAFGIAGSAVLFAIYRARPTLGAVRLALAALLLAALLLAAAVGSLDAGNP